MLVVDLNELYKNKNSSVANLQSLVSCAQAVEQSDYRRANELIGELRQHSSAYGNAQQRMAHYFTEALVSFCKP